MKVYKKKYIWSSFAVSYSKSTHITRKSIWIETNNWEKYRFLEVYTLYSTKFGTENYVAIYNPQPISLGK